MIVLKRLKSDTHIDQIRRSTDKAHRSMGHAHIAPVPRIDRILSSAQHDQTSIASSHLIQIRRVQHVRRSTLPISVPTTSCSSPTSVTCLGGWRIGCIWKSGSAISFCRRYSSLSIATPASFSPSFLRKQEPIGRARPTVIPAKAEPIGRATKKDKRRANHGL